MGFSELFILALALSMDAFAVAVCAGLSMQKADLEKSFIVGLYFGIFQAVMPVIGYFATSLFADRIMDYSNFIAFALLCFIGGKMVFDSFKKEESTGNGEYSLKPLQMLPLALATSIDALAIGVVFAMEQVSIAPAASLIGVVTLVISMAGVKIGSIFGAKFKSKAQLAGGVILVLIGVRLLVG